LERLKKIRAHRGLRHYWGLRVRGQHTKTTGRKGRTVGVSKKKSTCFFDFLFDASLLISERAGRTAVCAIDHSRPLARHHSLGYQRPPLDDDCLKHLIYID